MPELETTSNPTSRHRRAQQEVRMAGTYLVRTGQMTPSELSHLTGLTRQSIAQWAGGHVQPTARQVYIAKLWAKTLKSARDDLAATED